MVKITFSDELFTAIGVNKEWAKDKSAARILSAAGHPGYGSAFSVIVLKAVERGEGSLHQIIYRSR